MPYTFVISDESLNRAGFWVLTEGIDLSQFQKNPIMYFMHTRPFHENKDAMLPIGHWENIRVENRQVLADAVFDNDEFSQTIKSKVDSNTLRMASAGLEPVEVSEDEEYLKQGQTSYTVTKSIMLEASIVDRGMNTNALRLYNQKANVVELSSDSINQLIPKLKDDTMNLNAQALSALNLADNSDENAVNNAILQLVQNKNELSKQVENLKKERDELKQAEEKRQKDAFEAALNNDAKKLSDQQKKNMRELAEKAGYEIAKQTVDAMPDVQNLRDYPKGGNDDKRKNWTFADYQKNDPQALEEMKQNDPQKFGDLFEEHYGRRPK